MATPFLELDGDSDLNITTEQATGSYTAPADGLFGCDFRIASMKNTAATITARLAHTSAADALIRSWYFSLPKFTATDTVFGSTFAPVPVKSGEKLVLYLQSTNADDTAVTWQVDWFDGMAADAVKVSGDITAADNFETMLDGTGGKKLTLEQLRIDSASAGGAIDVDNSDGPGAVLSGSTYGIFASGSNNIGFYASGGDYGMMATGGNIGIYASGSGATGFYASGGDYGMMATSDGNAGLCASGTGAASHGFEAVGAGSGIGFYCEADAAAIKAVSSAGNGIEADGDTGDIVGDITGDLSGSVDSVTDPVDLIDAPNSTALAAIADEVAAMLADETRLDVDSTAADPLSVKKVLEALLAVLAGKVTVDTETGEEQFMGRDGTTPIAEVTAATDGNRTASEIS